MRPANVLMLPSWQGSGPCHWLTAWERRFGYVRVEQHDWRRPLRGDWIARLEDVLLAGDGPAVLVAHGLGCQLLAAWAACSRHPARVRAALLAAPADTEQPALRERLASWAPVAWQRLPFPSVLVADRGNALCSPERARLFAHAWGSRFVDDGDSGRLDADGGPGSWPEGQVLLQDLVKD